MGLEIVGFPRSNFVRAVRMVAEEKGVDYELVAEMPHGGFKSSGHGKDLSMYGLEDYTRIKHVMAYTG